MYFACCFNHKALQEYLLEFLEFTFGFHKLCCVNRLFRNNFPLSVYGVLDTQKVAGIEREADRTYTITHWGERHGIFVASSNFTLKRFYRFGCVHGDERFFDSPTKYSDSFYFDNKCVYGWLQQYFFYNDKMIYKRKMIPSSLICFQNPYVIYSAATM